MAQPVVGNIQIYGLSSGSITTVSGKTAPQLQTIRVTHNPGDMRELKNAQGQVVGVMGPDDEVLECTFDVIPAGTSANDSANALNSAYIPAALTSMTVSGLQNITVGGFVNALNGSWVYTGGAQLNASNDNTWTISVPAKKYKNVTLP